MPEAWNPLFCLNFLQTRVYVRARRSPWVTGTTRMLANWNDIYSLLFTKKSTHVNQGINSDNTPGLIYSDSLLCKMMRHSFKMCRRNIVLYMNTNEKCHRHCNNNNNKSWSHHNAIVHGKQLIVAPPHAYLCFQLTNLKMTSWNVKYMSINTAHVRDSSDKSSQQ